MMFSGYSSGVVLKTIEHEVPFIALSLLANENHYVCQRTLELNIGTCILHINQGNISQALDRAISNYDSYKQALHKYNIVVESKKDEEEDIYYWIDYAMEVGTDHFVNKYIYVLGFLAFYDVDVNFAIFIVLTVGVVMAILIIQRVRFLMK
mmetsp:Transcript_40490/g.38979  ORF Transcript_40490/g.38979 Transcript_40490/m.38979 type:complete len:151 (-) Transcript_40490:77-529(-)